MTRSSRPTEILPPAPPRPISSSSGQTRGWFLVSPNQKEVGCRWLRISFPRPPVSISFRLLPLCDPSLTFRIGGEVKLRSSNPFDLPIINPNFLTTDFDIKTIVAAFKTGQRFMTAKAWEGFVIGAWEQPTSASTDEEFVQYARNFSTTYVQPLDWFLFGYSNTICRLQ